MVFPNRKFLTWDDIQISKNEPLSVKLTTLKYFRKDFWIQTAMITLLNIPSFQWKKFWGNCFLSLINFMVNQHLSWKISTKVTHQDLPCRKMKTYSLWLTSNANKQKSQNNVEIISTTASSKIYSSSQSPMYSCHMRFYFWMKAALIKRFNCLSVCLMVKLLHLLQAWVSLPIQSSRLLSILRWCLISVTLVMKAANTAYFPFLIFSWRI